LAFGDDLPATQIATGRVFLQEERDKALTEDARRRAVASRRETEIERYLLNKGLEVGSEEFLREHERLSADTKAKLRSPEQIERWERSFIASGGRKRGLEALAAVKATLGWRLRSKLHGHLRKVPRPNRIQLEAWAAEAVADPRYREHRLNPNIVMSFWRSALIKRGIIKRGGAGAERVSTPDHGRAGCNLAEDG
jgi:hypothetical protein